MNDNILIQYLNINGLISDEINKMDIGFIRDLIENAEILCLSETWMVSTLNMTGLKNHLTFQKTAVKKKKKGRASGGFLVFFHKKFSSCVREIEISEIHAKDEVFWFSLIIRNQVWFIGFVYIQPELSSVYTYKDFPHENIKRDIAHFSAKGKVCMIGDWNGRTAEARDFVENDDVIDDLFPSEYSVDDELLETKRISEDSLVTPDRFGKSLLDICKCSNMQILNGRFGEASSKFTCNTWNGSSVVDYAIVEKDLMAKINSFEVGEIIDESDHCVIQFSIQNDWKFSRPMKQNVKNQRRKALKFPNQ